MKNDPWRASRHLIFGHIGSLVALPEKSWVDATTKFVRHYQHVRLAEVQGGLSIEPLEYADFVATRSIVSLAAMTVTISDVQQFAGNAFPCHELGRTRGRLMVSYAECVFMDRDTARSLSEVLISKGVAFVFGDGAGQPVFRFIRRWKTPHGRPKPKSGPVSVFSSPTVSVTAPIRQGIDADRSLDVYVHNRSFRPLHRYCHPPDACR